MKHLKLFENFEITQPLRYGDPLNQKEINFLEGYNIMCSEFILKDDNYYYVFNHRCEKIKDLPITYIHGVCSKFEITNYTINDDFTVDVSGDVDLMDYYPKLTKIPLKFNNVDGYFDCSLNNLTTLEGSPKEVSFDFDCSHNQLITLEGGPEFVHIDFCCHNNKLTSLKGGPEFVGGGFDCSSNQLTTLKGAPNEVMYFNCLSNKLTTLKGGPKKVTGFFNCGSNKLTKLDGAPEYVGGYISYKDNPPQLRFTRAEYLRKKYPGIKGDFIS
jgi:hypothetical protein